MGSGAAFVAAGDYHPHLGLNTWESRGGAAPARGTTGLYHAAILYPSRATLADALRRLQDAGVALEGAADHGVSEALYLRDPDGNGLELYRDRPIEEWPRDAAGEVLFVNAALDLAALLAEPAPTAAGS
jgi:catechol 2,3-dioxygenase